MGTRILVLLVNALLLSACGNDELVGGRAQAVGSTSSSSEIEQLDQQIANQHAAFELSQQPINRLRTMARKSRAAVTVSITDVFAPNENPDTGDIETKYVVQITRVNRVALGYVPNASSIIFIGGQLEGRLEIMSDVPSVSVGKSYLVLKGAGDASDWRGLTQFDVLELAGDGSLIFPNGGILAPSDVDNALQSIGADYGSQ